MFDKMKVFVAEYSILLIIGGIIFVLAGAVMTVLMPSLYFLIAVAVGLIVAVASGFMKNKEIKGYEQQTIVTNENITSGSCPENENQKVHEQENDNLHDQNEAAPPISTPTLENNQELDEYKKKARKRITKEYVQLLLTDVEKRKKIDESEDMCSSLIQENGFGLRGDTVAFNIIKSHFYKIKIKDISKNPEVIIRGNIEVLFEVLTGCEYQKAGEAEKNLVENLQFKEKDRGDHIFVKCFFEHTILCALEIYKDRELLKLYTDKTLTDDEKCQKTPLLQFYDWNKDHKYGSVLKQPKTDTSLDQNPFK